MYVQNITHVTLYNQAQLTWNFILSSSADNVLYPLERHNHSSHSIAGDEAQLWTMFQKHIAWAEQQQFMSEIGDPSKQNCKDT